MSWASSNSTHTIVLVYALVTLLVPTNFCSAAAAASASSTGNAQNLSVEFYSKTCPQLEQLVSAVTSKQFKDAPVSAPATIRLFFNDCFVDGCDGSILVSSRVGAPAAERDDSYDANIAQEAFDGVNKAKALVESKCPAVVSCADILAVAARDFVHLTGGPYYQVKKGRRDGQISMAAHVKPNLPASNATLDDLLRLFGRKGLNQDDLVVLSGAHTIGFAQCKEFRSRLYNFKGTHKPDPSMDKRLLKALKMTCPHRGGNRNVVAPLDVSTPFLFDEAYYGNLVAGLGLLATDQALFLDPRTRPLVQALAKDKARFFQAFSSAMDKMGSIEVKVGNQGQIRKNCTK